jgi:hypothetical protein
MRIGFTDPLLPHWRSLRRPGGRSAGSAVSVTRRCPTCSFTRPYPSAALADYHHPRHSCGKHLHQADVAHRR